MVAQIKLRLKDDLRGYSYEYLKDNRVGSGTLEQQYLDNIMVWTDIMVRTDNMEGATENVRWQMVNTLSKCEQRKVQCCGSLKYPLN